VTAGKDAGPNEDHTMRKFVTIGFTALTLALGAPLAASAAAIPHAPAALGSLSENAGKTFTAGDAQQTIENCRCRRYTRYRTYRYRYHVRYYVVYW
jgi:hypothetical protein